MTTTRPASCSIGRAMDLLGERWTMLILREAFWGVRRFTELQRNLGIARNILSSRLQALVAAEILERLGPALAYHEGALRAAAPAGHEDDTRDAALRASLSQLGIEHLLVSSLPTTSILPKAHVLNQRTMEILDDVGVATATSASSTIQLRPTGSRPLSAPSSHDRACSCLSTDSLTA